MVFYRFGEYLSCHYQGEFSFSSLLSVWPKADVTQYNLWLVMPSPFISADMFLCHVQILIKHETFTSIIYAYCVGGLVNVHM
jgi:hypothetical protein